MDGNSRRKIVEAVAGIAFGLAICVSCFVILGGLLAVAGDSRTDEISYWAAGRQILHHGDPYDRGAIYRLERSAGFDADHPQMMRNVPSALLVAVPLGAAPQRASSRAWAVFTLIALFGSVVILWRLDRGQSIGPYLLGLAFGPAAACLNSGQMGVLLLAGLVLFLALEASWPFCAGFALWLCFLKPHLFVPFAVVLLLWIVRNRRYRIMAGLLMAVSAGVVFIAVLDPHVWAQYGAMLRTEGIEREPIPCLGIALRDAVWPHGAWLQYVPCVIGTVWAVWYYRRRSERWSWVENGGLVVLVSVLVAPYAWFTDQAVILPVLLYVAARTSTSMLALFAVCSAAIQFFHVEGLTFHSRLFVLAMPMWLAWYLLARRGAERRLVVDSEMAVAVEGTTAG